MNAMFSHMDPVSDNEFASSIAPDVMTCLQKCDYFKKLDDILSPKDSANLAKPCDGTYRTSKSILLGCGFTQADLDDIFAVLQFKGGHCDCEVLYNVSESSRLKTKYWQSRAAGQNPDALRHPTVPT